MTIPEYKPGDIVIYKGQEKGTIEDNRGNDEYDVMWPSSNTSQYSYSPLKLVPDADKELRLIARKIK